MEAVIAKPVVWVRSWFPPSSPATGDLGHRYQHGDTGLLIWLPYAALLVIGIIIVAGHNILDFAEAKNTAHPGLV